MNQPSKNKKCCKLQIDIGFTTDIGFIASVVGKEAIRDVEVLKDNTIRGYMKARNIRAIIKAFNQESKRQKQGYIIKDYRCAKHLNQLDDIVFVRIKET